MPVGNPFKLKAREQEDLVDTAGDASPSVSSKNNDVATAPGPLEPSDERHVSANFCLLITLIQ